MLPVTDLEMAKQTLLAELREHSLILGEVTLASGAVAQYYVDARRTLMQPAGFKAAGELIGQVMTSSTRSSSSVTTGAVSSDRCTLTP